jgi:hypothetical protein
VKNGRISSFVVAPAAAAAVAAADIDVDHICAMVKQ